MASTDRQQCFKAVDMWRLFAQRQMGSHCRTLFFKRVSEHLTMIDTIKQYQLVSAYKAVLREFVSETSERTTNR